MEFNLTIKKESRKIKMEKKNGNLGENTKTDFIEP